MWTLIDFLWLSRRRLSRKTSQTKKTEERRLYSQANGKLKFQASRRVRRLSWYWESSWLSGNYIVSPLSILNNKERGRTRIIKKNHREGSWVRLEELSHGNVICQDQEGLGRFSGEGRRASEGGASVWLSSLAASGLIDPMRWRRNF